MNAKQKAALRKRARKAVANTVLRTANLNEALWIDSYETVSLYGSARGAEDAAIRRAFRRAAKLVRGGK